MATLFISMPFSFWLKPLCTHSWTHASSRQYLGPASVSDVIQLVLVGATRDTKNFVVVALFIGGHCAVILNQFACRSKTSFSFRYLKPKNCDNDAPSLLKGVVATEQLQPVMRQDAAYFTSLKSASTTSSFLLSPAPSVSALPPLPPLGPSAPAPVSPA